MSKSLLSTEFFAFNTHNAISIHTEDTSILTGAIELCSRYEMLFSRTRPKSEIAQINRAGGTPVSVDNELLTFIETSLCYCAQTHGLFDITMGKVIELWDFKNGHIPNQNLVNESLRHVDYKKVQVTKDTVTLEDPCAKIDLGGIAKGYITDALVDFLKSKGVTSGLINLGGNVFALGEKPGGAPWSVGIRMPTPSSSQKNPEIFASVGVRDMSVVTSGVYERAFSHNNQLYHHILDPKTGFPAKTNLISATIIAKTSLDADGYTTALILMGLDNALDFVENNPNIEAIFVSTDGSAYTTTGVEKNFLFTLCGS